MSGQFQPGLSETKKFNINSASTSIKEPQKVFHSRPVKKILLFFQQKFINRWGITEKFAYSYTLAIGIAICGTTGGLLLGDYYQEAAEQRLKFISEQQIILNHLDKVVTQLRLHPQALVPTLGNSIWFQYEKDKFYDRISQVDVRLKTIKLANRQNKSEYSATAVAALIDLVEDYEATILSYRQLVESVWEAVDPAKLDSEDIPASQQYVLSVMTQKNANDISVQFERISEHLTQLNALAEAEKQTAYGQAIHAKYLRIKIIAASMLLSAAIAAALAFYTSRAIVLPLKKVTQVAQQVTGSRTFDQQAPVLTEDEVGLLAHSLNQLIKWAAEYTQELENAFADLRQTQAQLIQNEKMSSLGQMVAGVAHEINNPVSFIYGNIEHAKDYTQDILELVQLYQQHYPHPVPEIQDHIEAIDLEFLLEDLPKVLDSMKMGGDRIKQIVLSLRNFSRLDEAEMKEVNLHEGMDNTLLILNNRFNKAGIKLHKTYGNLPLIECYPAQLNQVFMNIVANAIDALEMRDLSPGDSQPAKEITISTSQVDSGHICVKIADNAGGIPADIQAKIFDHFFTTKAPGKGTGLGLAISYQIIEKHQGNIELNSVLGQGSEFAITLPISFAQKSDG